MSMVSAHSLHNDIPCQDQCWNWDSFHFETFGIILARSWHYGLDNPLVLTMLLKKCMNVLTFTSLLTHPHTHTHTHTHTHMWVNVKTTQCTHVMLEKKLLSRPVFKNALFSAILNCTDAKKFFSLFPNFFPLKKQNFNKIYHMSKFQIY